MTPARPERSRSVALWLFAVAAMVLAMILVGGGTRLTDSGLSITEWRPVTGAIPPLSQADWQAEFDRYRQIPEYVQVNAGMSLAEFQFIYWWEWAHRLLGRVIGLVFLLPFLVFAATRRLPRRLLAPCAGLFVLGGLQGAVGWWMVSSGLVDRVDVAPERLTVHLGLALVLFIALIWTGLEAWFGPRRGPVLFPGLARAAAALLGLCLLQSLLGGLVAGNDAGLVYNDFPTMGGRLVPPDYAGPSLWATLAHSQAAVQFHHRLGAYALFAAALAFAWAAGRSRVDETTKTLALTLAALVTAQAALGIATLVNAAPLGLSAAHQFGAVLVLAAATALAWRARRAGQARTLAHGPVIASVMPGQ